ncbi:MAG: S41 family peptidase [Actinobacteria bacterium]|nr:S41 family peptidase [Actinomycetota bacterium]
MKKFFITFAAVVLVVSLLTGTFAIGLLAGRRLQGAEQARLSSSYPSVEKVGEAMHLIRASYVEEVSTERLVEGAVKGMVEALKDPYTHYLSKKDFNQFKEDTAGRFEGVGMVVGANKDGQIAVVSPLEGTPADRAGIKAGDMILEIDGKETKGMSVDDAVAKIRGKKGTQVKLTLRRGNEQEPVRVSLTREEIKLPNVTAKVLENKIGYIRVHSFNEQTDKDLRSKIEQVKKDNVKGIILDLRNNPGGLLEEAVMVTSKFIDSGAVVKVKGRDGKVQSHLVRPDQDTDTKIPLVVLVNHGSASASEIVAGAVQDYHRGTIVGEKTFGKASVQTVINLSDGTGLLLTTDTYLTPNGRLIHKKGIEPDVPIKYDEKAMAEGKDAQLGKAKEVLEELISGKRKP